MRKLHNNSGTGAHSLRTVLFSTPSLLIPSTIPPIISSRSINEAERFYALQCELAEQTDARGACSRTPGTSVWC